MRKTALILAIIALTTLIVLPVITPVNHSAGNPTSIDRTQSADGGPLPPPPPPLTMGATLVADGGPLPPPPPPKVGASLVADVSPAGMQA